MILIGFGSNLPFCGRPPAEVLVRAVAAVGTIARLKRISSVYASPAWPDPSDPEFRNRVAVIETVIDPQDLMNRLHRIENAFGRQRSVPNAPRTLDLDLLAVGDLVVSGQGSELVLPHPRLADRAFVLGPIAEIAPQWTHPTLNQTAQVLLERIEGQMVRRLDKNDLSHQRQFPVRELVIK
ncbi:MAG: 2-amino-4-hydroxy-6-hydroxymethyldihydropteridine diphosphokinase [Pseudomonadota bacterium]